MSQPVDSPSSLTPDRGLPPVEPPSARFILQLFVVPAVIVTIIILVWLLFNWLAQMGSDPTKYVAALRSNSKARWQAAASLADVLNDPRNAAFKQDRRLAQDLASLLSDELKDTSGAEEQTMLAVFLCRALGEFEVVEAVPPLVDAAGRTRSEDAAVRGAALEGLAVLAANLPADEATAKQQIDAVFVTAAEDKDPQVRGVAAYALGVVGDANARALLTKLLSDVYPDVRFDAAAGLARRGDPAGLPVILEMLTLEAPRSSQDADVDAAAAGRRELIVANGLQAALAIHAAVDGAGQESLRNAITQLSSKDQPEETRLRAVAALRQLEQPAAPAK